ncbi:hypothetical protein CYMTET_6910 [Cymbomonas tetramitiformis]|uniref:BZIP domain-containing protein n=1 Tax=Cymbomonas tetramitiformis TaxID=36881 RepID=A0AAE0GW41_9CHLO|nr:hypothetical protein CYMTET_6910 [Cymbomonas tetramitiformis]
MALENILSDGELLALLLSCDERLENVDHLKRVQLVSLCQAQARALDHFRSAPQILTQPSAICDPVVLSVSIVSGDTAVGGAESDALVPSEICFCEQGVGTGPVILDTRSVLSRKGGSELEEPMISNRESARRSRRRKLEHVQCLDSQISQLQAENHNLLDRLSSMEQRAREAMYENCQLKEEVDALKLQLRACTGKMNRSASLQRVASQEHLAKRRGGIMREPMLPDEAVENCRQESAGCGLFRSLGSYENIVQLQFSSPGVTGS